MAARHGYVEIQPEDSNRKTAYYKCTQCGHVGVPREVSQANQTCPRCGAYFRMRPWQRLKLTVDEGSFQGMFSEIEGGDPLEYPGYTEKKESLHKKHGAREAIACGTATVHGLPLCIAVMDTAFMMASMGYAVGERLTRLFDYATEHKLPVVVFCASGGARMQEGLVSLMQMAKVSCAVERHREAGLFYLSVLTDPTTGGVTASFAMQGDVILAEPKALIGFAGRRVVESTVRQKLPEDFQTAEFALEHGLIDGLVAREDMRQVIAELILLHRSPAQLKEDLGDDNGLKFLSWMDSFGPRTGRRTEDFMRARLGRGKDAERQEQKALKEQVKLQMIADKKAYAEGRPPMLDDERREKRDKKMSAMAAKAGIDVSAWEKVKLARRIDRPTAVTYREALVDGFLQMHGDRSFADDEAIIAGLGFIGGHAVTVITQEKGTTTAERIRHNFGCARPEGYRKAIRLAKQAEAFGRPVVCLVDTQGAHCDAQSEERGQGSALADCLVTFAGLRVPVISVILSEGGSGGALALALGDRVAMMENAVYSILTPEGFASILWKDVTRAPEAADVMKPTAQDALEMGVVDMVIPEPAGGAHLDPAIAARSVKAYVSAMLDELCACDMDELLAKRQQRFDSIGL